VSSWQSTCMGCTTKSQ